MLSTTITGRMAFLFSSFIPTGSSSAAIPESAGSEASAARACVFAVVPAIIACLIACEENRYCPCSPVSSTTGRSTICSNSSVRLRMRDRGLVVVRPWVEVLRPACQFDPGFGSHQRVDREFLALAMELQAEALRQQPLHHFRNAFRGPAFRQLRHDVEPLCTQPLRTRDLCEPDPAGVRDQRRKRHAAEARLRLVQAHSQRRAEDRRSSGAGA